MESNCWTLGWYEEMRPDYRRRWEYRCTIHTKGADGQSMLILPLLWFAHSDFDYNCNLRIVFSLSLSIFNSNAAKLFHPFSVLIRKNWFFFYFHTVFNSLSFLSGCNYLTAPVFKTRRAMFYFNLNMFKKRRISIIFVLFSFFHSLSFNCAFAHISLCLILYCFAFCRYSVFMLCLFTLLYEW